MTQPPNPTRPTPARRHFLRAAVAAACGVALAAAGCGGKPPKIEIPAAPPPPPPPKPPSQLGVTVKSAGNANGGLPIVVRVYELKASGGFSGADFFSLYENDAAVLADALVAREQMTLAPGQSHSINKQLSPDARYIGVMGAFRDIDNAQWRRVVPLAADTDNRLSVTIGANDIRIETL
jgi:type VI secretion system protein VasD